MRLYLIHRKYYLKYLQAQKAVEDILDEQELLLQRVQPKSALAEHEREYLPSNPTTGGRSDSKKAEDYAIEVERRNIRIRLDAAKEIMLERKIILIEKEKELRKSKDIYNMIYTCRFIDGMKADAIVDYTGYSRSQVYNILGHLEKQLERSE